MSEFYILDDEHRPVRTTLEVWAQWFEVLQNRLVDSTQVNSQVMVSTVFLGLDHRFGGNGPPLLFETMIFGGPHHHAMWRYSSWDDAVAGHSGAVRKARARQ